MWVLASGAAGQGSPGGNGPPNPHSISNDSTAIFAQVNLLLCPNGLAEEIICNIDLCNITSNHCNDDDSTADTTDDPLTKRAGPRTYTVNLNNGGVIVLSSRPYPSRGTLLNGAAGAQVFNRALDYISPDLCDDFDVIDHDLTRIVLSDFVTEHLLEVSTLYQICLARTNRRWIATNHRELHRGCKHWNVAIGSSGPNSHDRCYILSDQLALSSAA